jgi:type II secretory pathway pseudopilin PulG
VLLIVWIVVGVLAVVVLGALAYGVQGARVRLAREVTAFEREVRPLLDQVADTTERVGRTDDR